MFRFLIFVFVFFDFQGCMAQGLASSSDPNIKTLYNQEPTQTFYVKKRNNNKLKLVLEVGDKINLEYISDSGEANSLIGALTAIDTDWIKVDETPILLDKIVEVNFFKTKRAVFGSLSVLGGSGLIASGVALLYKASQGPTFFGNGWEKKAAQQISGAFLILAGGGITALSTVKLIIPQKFNKSKFSFNTYTS